MIKILFDTNIVLDVLLQRSPWVVEGQALWQLNDLGKITGYLTATTLTDIFYFAQRTHDLDKANQAIDLCLQTFDICPVNLTSLQLARSYAGKDFEDNLQIACAVLSHLDVIITRNPNDFTHSPIPVWTPAFALQQVV